MYICIYWSNFIYWCVYMIYIVIYVLSYPLSYLSIYLLIVSFFSARAPSYFFCQMIHKPCHLLIYLWIDHIWFVCLSSWFLVKTEWIGEILARPSKRDLLNPFNWCWASPTTMSPFNKLTGAESVTSLQRPPTQSHSKLGPAMARSDAFEATLAQLRRKHRGQATFANSFSQCEKYKNPSKIKLKTQVFTFSELYVICERWWYMWCMMIGDDR